MKIMLSKTKTLVRKEALFYISANLLNDSAEESRHLKPSVFHLFPYVILVRSMWGKTHTHTDM